MFECADVGDGISPSMMGTVVYKGLLLKYENGNIVYK